MYQSNLVRIELFSHINTFVGVFVTYFALAKLKVHISKA